jgi:hypothetical protein
MNRSERRAAERQANKAANKAAAREFTPTPTPLIPSVEQSVGQTPSSACDLPVAQSPEPAISPARLAANRENAQKSTGPKTDEAKPSPLKITPNTALLAKTATSPFFPARTSANIIYT